MQQVHGNLDLHSLFVTEIEGYLKVQLDISGFEGIRKNLKQDPTHSKYCHNSTSYNQFKQKQTASVQRDIQALGQIIFSLLVHTDL